jgi:Tripartite ATP-independent periplasmic transporters, DctQ component.
MAFDILFCLCIGVYAFLVTWMSVNMVTTAIQYSYKANTLIQTPLAIPYALLPIGMAFLVLQAIVDIIKLASRIKVGTTESGVSP